MPDFPLESGILLSIKLPILFCFWQLHIPFICPPFARHLLRQTDCGTICFRKEKKTMSYNAIITRESDGRYSAEVPQLPGCRTCGETLDEVRANLKEAISLYLEVCPEAASVESFYMQVSA